MSEWDRTWPMLTLLLVLALLPIACTLSVKVADWAVAGAVKLVRALRRLTQN